jgi:hypothetical protein
LVSLVGFSPNYVLLICVAGALSGTELSSGEHVMLYCVAGSLSGNELISGKCTMLYIILKSHINNLYFILYHFILQSYRKF